MITKEEILDRNPGFDYMDMTEYEDSPSYQEDTIDLLFIGDKGDLHMGTEGDGIWFLRGYVNEKRQVFVEGVVKDTDSIGEIFRLFAEADDPFEWHEVASVID